MILLDKLREQYGDALVTIFPDELVVPWRLLTMDEYIGYSMDRSRGMITPALLEDEIFKKCVLDDVLLRQFASLKAGTVTTVVAHIWEHSGPASIASFNNDLEMARQILHSEALGAIHELVQIVTMAFPYKPEEVYEMNYDDFIIRVAQAEDKLLKMKMIDQPLSMTEKEKPRQIQQARKPGVNLAKLWNERQTPTIKPIDPEQPFDWEDSPVLSNPPAHGIDFKREQREHDSFSGGHEAVDLHIARAKMIEDAKLIYAPLIDKVKK